MRVTVRLWGESECVTYTLQSYSLGRPKSGVCEQFVHPPNLAVYRKNLDMNELSEITRGEIR